MSDLTHIDEHGAARMVDVADKQVGDRRAVAQALVRMSPETAAAVAAGDAPKGDVLGVARIAGIQAAKRTGELIPLCHPIGLDHVDVEAAIDAGAGLVTIVATARVSARTGVEMEAMTAAAIAALTVYDMVKGLDRGVSDRARRAAREVGRPLRATGSAAERHARRRRRRRHGGTVPADARRRAHDLLDARPRRGQGRLRAAPRRAARGRRLRDRTSRCCPTTARAIEARLRELVADDVRFVFTTGGTGLTPDDVTPEATRAVIERDAPAFQQAMLIEGLRHQPMALLTRGVSGIAGRTLIVNFPGSPKAIDQLFPVLEPALQHAAESLVREGGRGA